jgi:two-component system NtrC family sensor kinase
LDLPAGIRVKRNREQLTVMNGSAGDIAAASRQPGPVASAYQYTMVLGQRLVIQEIGAVINMHQEQCISCHGESEPPENLPMEARARIVRRGEHRVLGITQTIRNEPDCSNASCHVHGPDEHLLGVLDVNLALGPYDQARSESAAELLVASFLGIILVVAITILASQRMVHKPVRMLIRETKRIASGDLSARVPEVSEDEIGVLARTFNRMARDLEVARSELLEWGRTLEDRVRQKTEELQRAQLVEVN